MTGGRTPWRSARFVAVDVETTGLDPRRDEVLSFAAVPVERGRILARAAVGGLVHPDASPPASSIEIHGLREADLAAAPPAHEAFAALVAALEGRIPVAHAASIERGFLRPRLRALGFRLPRRIIDTAVLWRLLCIRRGDGDPGWCALSEVAAALGLPSHRPHVAEGDALTTAQAFLVLATHLESGGRGTVRALAAANWDVHAYRLWHSPFRPG
ncbi:MAG: polymerase subunit epsilon [Thermoleophilaceae bacterium]|nr:polymerase subunit epsilon [Thermoleophilaceae bacterium]MEA2403265.1 polymerase subunit epsilon [Thermoleophilaceae bacterium]